LARVVKPAESWWINIEAARRLSTLIGDTNKIVNLGGEVIDRMPEEIAYLIKRGYQWIDYTGYPMYYFNTTEEWLLEDGFRRFLTALGIPSDLEIINFWSYKYGGEYPRSLVVLQPIKLPAGITFVTPTGEYSTIEPSIYSMFALKVDRGGYYYYAYADIPPDEYANFIKKPSKLPLALAIGVPTAIGIMMYLARK